SSAHSSSQEKNHLNRKENNELKQSDIYETNKKNNDDDFVKSPSEKPQPASGESDEQQRMRAQRTNQDPDMRKLESVENARDPAYLIKAQMVLQAQQKPVPKNYEKKW
ncbi:hypothetical protein QTV44_002621, partial [Vibrio vulnificus]|nr:hypothetical protein [Vibrio vulnificus]